MLACQGVAEGRVLHDATAPFKWPGMRQIGGFHFETSTSAVCACTAQWPATGAFALPPLRESMLDNFKTSFKIA